MSKTLHWGIIGTGRIAHVFARGIAESQTGVLVAVGSRTLEAATAFGNTWNISRCYASYEALLADDEVQAVYIATPHTLHARWAIKAAEAGKHILCEKPFALNHAEAMAMIEAAVRNDVFLMEAFMYRCHPQTTRLLELLRSRIIGDVRVIQASFSFNSGAFPRGRLFSNELGGGGMLDVGCYCTSIARLIAGVATGQNVAEPLQVTGTAHLGETGVDEYAAASLLFPGDILANLFAGIRVNGGSSVQILGSEGSIFLPSPFTPPSGKTGALFVKRDDEQTTREMVVESDSGLYALEADTVAQHLAERQAPAMTWQDTLGNMQTLDRWRAAVGLVYEGERPTGQTLPLSGSPLHRLADNAMKYGQIAGVEKPVSRLVMGVDNQVTWPHASVMFDDFFERGGNCFDVAYIYGGGRCESVLGQWINNRGVRDEVVLLGKGAHTPHCNPEALRRQLMESLERLQVDYVDIYMMHRDNPEIPVGEFITVLNELKQEGYLHAFGGSNWSLERAIEANAWAAEHGMEGFAALSNNFSLARMVDPVWSGCLSVSDADSRAWFVANQMPLMPWSSQARGFFVGHASRADTSDKELVRCWYSEDNFERLERVQKLAAERGVLPITLALAYVLCQPFPTFPLIGPRLLSETRTSFLALALELTPADLRWLNLED